jgi:hypothetical protein
MLSIGDTHNYFKFHIGAAQQVIQILNYRLKYKKIMSQLPQIIKEKEYLSLGMAQ